VQLDGEADRGEGVDASEAAQRGDGGGVPGIEGKPLDVREEILEALLDLVDGGEVVVEDDRADGVLEAKRLEPAAVSEVPGALAREGDGAAEEELRDTVTCADEVLAQVLASAGEVASGFVFLGERLDLGEEPARKR
jgi:hypothetical protein